MDFNFRRLTGYLLIAITSLGLAAGCAANSDAESGGSTTGDTRDNESTADRGDAVDATDTKVSDPEETETACEAPEPNYSCVQTCMESRARRPVCRQGEWSCPSGTTRISECSSSGDATDQTDADPDDSSQPRECSTEAKPTCLSSCDNNVKGGPPTCEAGNWVCPESTTPKSECPSPDPNADCETQTEKKGMVRGIEINFEGDCKWSQSEVESGISFPYEIIIENKIEGVIPKRPGGYACQDPGPSNLIAFERIWGQAPNGEKQEYCLCDVGLCAPNKEKVTVQSGTYQGSFDWSGHNWRGPSDTNNPKGDLFPPGTYNVSVTVAGDIPQDDQGNKISFEVKEIMEIEITQ